MAVASLRAETVSRLQPCSQTGAASDFPPAEIALDGWMEKLIPAHPAVEIEERYRAVLRDNRARDAAAGRTLDGPHLTDLSVVYARQEYCRRATPRPASRRRCSSGLCSRMRG